MDFSTLNYVAIAVAALAAFFIGAIWFGPKTFYPLWAKELGQDPQARIERTPAPVMFGMTFVAQLAMAFAVALVLQWVEAANGSVGLADGVTVGVILGVFIAAAASLGHRLFAQHGFKVWLMEVGNDVVAILAISVILSIWR